eukprot:4266483-Prymnesium_polylepis.1
MAHVHSRTMSKEGNASSLIRLEPAMSMLACTCQLSRSRVLLRSGVARAAWTATFAAQVALHAI